MVAGRKAKPRSTVAAVALAGRVPAPDRSKPWLARRSAIWPADARSGGEAASRGVASAGAAAAVEEVIWGADWRTGPFATDVATAKKASAAAKASDPAEAESFISSARLDDLAEFGADACAGRTAAAPGATEAAAAKAGDMAFADESTVVLASRPAPICAASAGAGTPKFAFPTGNDPPAEAPRLARASLRKGSPFEEAVADVLMLDAGWLAGSEASADLG